MAVETEKVRPIPMVKRTSYLIPALTGAALGGAVLALSTKVVVLIPAVLGMIAMLLVPGSTYYAMVAILPVYVEFGGVITVTRVVTMAALGIWIFQALTNRVPWPNLFCRPAGLLASAYFGGLVLSCLLTNPDPPGIAFRLGPYFIHAIIFFATLTFVRTEKDIERTLYILVAIAMLETVLVYLEAYYNFVPFVGIHEQLAEGLGDGVRVTGTSAHPIWLSGYFLLTIPATVTLVFLTRRIWLKLLLLIATGVQFYAWWLTGSRSGIIGMVALGFAALIAISKATRVVAIAMAVGGFGLLAAFGFSLMALVDAISNTELLTALQIKSKLNPGLTAFMWRLENWQMGLNLWLDHFFWGSASNVSTNYLMRYVPNDAIVHAYQSPAVPHNQFIMIASQNGIISLTFFTLLWIWGFNCIRKVVGNIELRHYGILLFVVLSAQFVHFWFNPPSRDIFFTLALSAAVGRMVDIKLGRKDQQPGQFHSPGMERRQE